MLAPLEGQPELLRLIRERLEQVPLSTDDLYAMIDPLQDAPDEFVGKWWLDTSRCRFWLCLDMDWKAVHEVEWQVQAIAQTLGLKGRFKDSTYGQPDVPCNTVLWEASAWMREQGDELVFLGTGGDDKLAVPLQSDLLAKAGALGLPAYLLSPSGSTSRIWG